MKNLYCIRHGLSEHNLNYFKYGVSTFYDPKYTDTSLVSEGYKQVQELRNTWKELSTIELVIVSPLRRTLQTASELFRGYNIPILVLEGVREYPMGKQTCNKRSNKDVLIKNYPQMNFDNLQTNSDELWLPHREETLEELNYRILNFIKFIKSRPETNIALVNHSSFIGQMKDNKIKYMENGHQELKHCYPYLMKL